MPLLQLPRQLQVQNCTESQPPADEVPYIQAFWDQLTEQQRQELLTLEIQQLQQKALELTQTANSQSSKPILAEPLPVATLSTMDMCRHKHICNHGPVPPQPDTAIWHQHTITRQHHYALVCQD